MQVKRMYKAKKKPKMAMGGMVGKQPQAMAGFNKQVAQAKPQGQQQAMSEAKLLAALQAKPQGQQRVRVAATPEQIRFAQAEQQINQANKAQAAQKSAKFVQNSNKAMQTFNNTAKLALANKLNPLNSRIQAAKASQAQKAPTGAINTGTMQMQPTQATPTLKPTAAPRSNSFSRQVAKAAPKPMMAKGGMIKANCGASMKPTQKSTKK